MGGSNDFQNGKETIAPIEQLFSAGPPSRRYITGRSFIHTASRNVDELQTGCLC